MQNLSGLNIEEIWLRTNPSHVYKDEKCVGPPRKKCWLRKVRKCGWEREMDPCEYPPVPFQSTAGSPRDPALKCSAAQIKNATNSNSFAPWTLERTNKPTDHWIWKHWNALKRTVNQELHDIQMQQTLLLPHAKKTFDILLHHIRLKITLKPIISRNLYLLVFAAPRSLMNLETIQNE